MKQLEKSFKHQNPSIPTHTSEKTSIIGRNENYKKSVCVFIVAMEVAMLQKTSPQAFLFPGIPGGADISFL